MNIPRRLRWYGAGAAVVAVVLAVVLVVVTRDGADHGSDRTPVAELASATGLADQVRSGPVDPSALGASVGQVVLLLEQPQDLDAFRASWGTGPRDMASQLGRWLGQLAGDVSPPSACGVRAHRERVADTAYVLELAVAAGGMFRPDGEIGDVLPAGTPPEVIEQITGGDFGGAARTLVDELGDSAARDVTLGLALEIREVLSAAAGADYLADYQSTLAFTRDVAGVGCE